MTGYVYQGTTRLDEAPVGAERTACYGKRGTVAGWHRHKKVLEQPCDRCREAYNEYHRKRRSDDASRHPRRLYSRAKNRAQRALAKRHAEEFEALFRQELSKVHAEAVTAS